MVKLAALADPRLRVSPQKLQEALHGQMHEQHRVLLQLFLERLDLVERQMTELAKVIGEAMRVHQQAITRLSLVPGTDAGAFLASRTDSHPGTALRGGRECGSLRAQFGDHLVCRIDPQ